LLQFEQLFKIELRIGKFFNFLCGVPQFLEVKHTVYRMAVGAGQCLVFWRNLVVAAEIDGLPSRNRFIILDAKYLGSRGHSRQ